MHASLLATMASLVFLYAPQFSSAAVHLQPITPDKIEMNPFIEEGAVNGGRAQLDQEVLSLLRIQKSVSKDGVEKIALTVGDKDGSPLKTTSFYQAALDEAGTRLVLDLSQVQQTTVDQNDLKKVLKISKLVRSGEITFDPVDQSMSLLFVMNEPVVMKSTAANGQIVLELKRNQKVSVK